MKKIVSIGLSLPSDDIEQLSVTEKASLLDADIIVIQPTLEYEYASSQYKGKPALSDSSSFAVREAASHWRRQITAALDAGKTVFVFLPAIEDVFVATGDQTYSGTGRNRVTTRHVEEFNNYDMLPFRPGTIIDATGRKMKFTSVVPELRSYWETFGPLSEYEVYIDDPKFLVGISTTSASKAVGGLTKLGGGTLILLPPIDWDAEEFEHIDEKTGAAHWSEEAIRLSHSLGAALVAIDEVCRTQSGTTPPPEWATGEEYRALQEETIEQRILTHRAEIERLENEISTQHEELTRAGSLRALLYETGIPLEFAVREALALFGFDTTHFIDDDSEFDAVFSHGDLRLLGEVEGKDKKAVNVDKLSQLERNIQEDFARDAVSNYAKGVLFSNAFRLTLPEERPDMFTEKVHKGAQRAGIALVRTPDMFEPAQYLKSRQDETYAAACRQAITDAQGIVVSFPRPPTTKLAASRSVRKRKSPDLNEACP